MKYFLLLNLLLTITNGIRFCPKECVCDLNEDSLNEAICENQNAITVELGVPADVQYYSLKGNSIYELESFTLKKLGYTSLIYLIISNNNLVWLGVHAFVGLNQLKHLDLSNNRLRTIANDLFYDNHKLEYVDLSSNMFHHLNDVPFLCHQNLKVLNLKNNRIDSFPSKMFTELPNVDSIDISDNYNLGLSQLVLSPLVRLKKLRLNNEYLKCSNEFKNLEKWIYERGIEYKMKCQENTNDMFERMISMPPQEKKETNIEDIWHIENKVINVSISGNLTFFERFNRIPSIWTIVMGFLIGFAFGTIFTYLCINNSKPQQINQRSEELLLIKPEKKMLSPKELRIYNMMQNYKLTSVDWLSNKNFINR